MHNPDQCVTMSLATLRLFLYIHWRLSLSLCLFELQALNKAQEPAPAWLLSASISDGFALSDINDVPIEAQYLKTPLYTDFL